jgi:hypothetical protein
MVTGATFIMTSGDSCPGGLQADVDGIIDFSNSGAIMGNGSTVRMLNSGLVKLDSTTGMDRHRR